MFIVINQQELMNMIANDASDEIFEATRSVTIDHNDREGFHAYARTNIGDREYYNLQRIVDVVATYLEEVHNFNIDAMVIMLNYNNNTNQYTAEVVIN